MQKYLLLLVCLIGTMNARAGITVVPPTLSESGAYELTFNSGDEGYASMSALPEYVKNATSLVIKSNGCTLSDSEMELLMGGDNTTTIFGYLESLDMGDAVLTNNESLNRMRYAKGENPKGLHKLTFFIFPKTTTSIPAGVFNENTTLQEVIMLEPDDPNASGLTEITAQAFQGCTSLSKIRIPDGVRVIGANAFEHCAFEAISFPNTLTTIATNAFGDCEQLKSITIPASVTYIGPSAFQKNYSMTDVYIIGNDVRIGDQAFDHNLTQNEFVYGRNTTPDPNNVTIQDWRKADGTLPLRLHIPNNQTALEHYMNPCLRVLNAFNDPSMVSQAIANLTGSTPSDEDVSQMISNIYNYYKERWFDNMNAHEGSQMCKNVIDKLIEMCGAHINSNDDLLPDRWETMDGWRYYHEADGRFNFGPNNSTSDYAGWWNFMFVAGDLDDVTWPDKRMIESRWYSAVFPFNLSYNQLMTAYGNGTDVREFSYVNEHTVAGKVQHTVTFNKRVSVPRLGKSNREDRDATTYIEKGRPYMIHPGVRSEQVTVNDEVVHRTIAGVNVKEANDVVANNSDLIVVEASLIKEGNSEDVLESNAYYFKGTFQLSTIPANTFYLGYDPDHGYPLAFYFTKKDLANKWSAFTSIVRKYDNEGSFAKSMDIDFKVMPIFEDIFGIATGIENVMTTTGRAQSQIVYNLNGQIVRENNTSLKGLSKGVYVVNGKKIVVR